MDNLFFIASKAFWFFARPENLPLIVFFLGFLALMRGRKRGALWFNGLGLVLYGGIALLPLGTFFCVRSKPALRPTPKLPILQGSLSLAAAKMKPNRIFPAWPMSTMPASGFCLA